MIQATTQQTIQIDQLTKASGRGLSARPQIGMTQEPSSTLNAPVTAKSEEAVESRSSPSPGPWVESSDDMASMLHFDAPMEKPPSHRSRRVLISCGTSLLRSLAWSGLPGALELSPDQNLYDLDGERSNLARQMLTELLPASGEDWDEESMLAAWDPGLWRKDCLKWMSAELSTLYLVDELHQLGSGDTIELIYSAGTPVCGELTALLMERRIEFRGTGRPRVIASPIEGLDATDGPAFVGALNRITETLSNQPMDTEQRIYCITGGYKGTVAAMLVQACWERTHLTSDGLAYYLYQDSSSLISIPLSFGPQGLEGARGLFRQA